MACNLLTQWLLEQRQELAGKAQRGLTHVLYLLQRNIQL